jgi:hypothetical protein
MYICNQCGHTQDKLKYARIYGDNLLEGYMDEVITDCACCKHGELVEATECSVCGRYFDNSSLFGVCEDCLAEHHTVGDALKFGDEEKIDVPINSFIYNILAIDKINQILEKYVEEHFTDCCKEVTEFCNLDKWAFSEYVENLGKESD